MATTSSKRTQTNAPLPEAQPPETRLRVDVFLDPAQRSTLARDVLEGLSHRPYHLPPKHFYDDVGSRLFDQICDTPEYYLTRAETALLSRAAPAIIAAARPTDLVELGSGAARKTRLLLDAFVRTAPEPRYVPIDVAEGMLRRSSLALLERYPTLHVHAVVGDYERHLAATPRGTRRLALFLGSTIGNFEPAEAQSFLASLRAQLEPGDALLMGVDLVKDPAVIERAYNDAQGITAAFNRNVLVVVNRTLGGDFEPDAFEHVARYNPDEAQIEMYLRASRAMTARVQALDLRVEFAKGDTIHTEISRKFTRERAEDLLRSAGFAPERWDTDEGRTFGLALASVRR